MFKDLNNLGAFLEDPRREIHVREFAKLQNISPATASSLLKRFAQVGFLKRKEVQNIHFYQLQLSQKTKDLKVFLTIQHMRKIIPSINEEFAKPTIILFGSAAKGEDRKESDIDLFLESEENEMFERICKKTGKIFHIFAYSSLRKIPNKHLQHNILNGIVLQGELYWN